MREGYKKTEIGVIPKDWEVYKFFDVINKIIDFRGRTPKKLGLDWGDGDILALSANNVKMGKIDFEIENYFASNQLYEKWMSGNELCKNDILMTMEAPLGNVALVPDNNKYILSQRVVALKTEGIIDNKFMLYMLMSDMIQNQFNMLSTGTTAKGINQKNLAKVKVVVPSLKEQEKIAEILSSVDSQIDDTEKLIEKAKELKKDLMQKLLTKGIGHSEFKKSEVGEIPVSWEVKKLEEIAKICYGKSQKEVECENGQFKILGTGGVMGYTNSFLWDKPSVLIGRKGTIDKPQYIDEPFWTVDTLFYTKINNKNLPKWFYYYMNNIDLKKYNEATGVPSLSVANLNTIKIITPPLKDQEKIVEILSSVDSEIEKYENKKQKLEELKKGLMQQLLTGKIRTII